MPSFSNWGLQLFTEFIKFRYAYRYKNKKTTTKKIAKAKVASKPKSKTNYLTTRILEQAANKAFANAAEQTMKVMGYNVIVQGDWVVKKFQDGTIEKISKLEKKKINKNLKFD